MRKVIAGLVIVLYLGILVACAALSSDQVGGSTPPAGHGGHGHMMPTEQ